jgi:hypothetical protein
VDDGTLSRLNSPLASAEFVGSTPCHDGLIASYFAWVLGSRGAKVLKDAAVDSV